MLRTLGGKNIGKSRLRAHQHPLSPPLSNLLEPFPMQIIQGKTRRQRVMERVLGDVLRDLLRERAEDGLLRASILDFKPKLANRCSQEVKTEAIPAAQGLKHCAAAGECWMGRDFGRRSRPWLRER